jgi:hypothetical protein
VREDRRSFGEEITPGVTGPVSGANDEEEEEEEKKGEEEEDEEEPVWTASAAGRILSGISGAIYVSFYCHA